MEEVPGYKAFPGNLSNEMYVAGVTSEAKSIHHHLNPTEPKLELTFRNFTPSLGSGLVPSSDADHGASIITQAGIEAFKEAAFLE